MLKGFALAALATFALTACDRDNPTEPNENAPGAVYVMTNEAAANAVIAYRRAADGTLSPLGTFPTGGQGTGRIRLSSQDPVVLSPNGRWLFVVNVGSDQVSVFSVRNDGLELVDVVASGGEDPYSITVHEELLYVLNNGNGGNITGFTVGADGHLTPLAGSTRPLSGAAVTDPAQVRFSPDGRTLVVTEKATDIIDTYAVGGNGLASGPVVNDIGDPDGTPVTPFGGDFTRGGTFVVTEAAGAEPGQAAASSFSITGGSALRFISDSVQDTQAEVCWTVITEDDRYAYVTNFQDGTISSYTVNRDGSIRLLEAIAATTSPGELSVRDHGLSQDGRYLYAIDIHSRMVHAWKVQNDGRLVEIGTFAGLPPTVAGLAAR